MKKKIIIVISILVVIGAVAGILLYNLHQNKKDNNSEKDTEKGGVNCFDFDFEYVELTRQDGTVIKIDGEEGDKIRAEFVSALDSPVYSGRNEELPIHLEFKNGWGRVNVALDSDKWMMTERYNYGAIEYQRMDSKIHDYLVSLYLGEEATLE